MLAFHSGMLESVRSLTTLFDTPLQLPPAAFHLLIMGPDLFLAQALPKNGNMTIGRADNADIRITDPLASRLHARLHVTEGMFEIEDIGSINRTKVRDVALEHGERVAVLPGEAVTIGSTILMVQETRAAARNRRVWPHTHFEARVEEECVHAMETRTPFAIIRLAVEGNQPAGTVADTISPALRTSDMLALYGPSDYEIFLPATPPELGSAINNDLIGRLRAQSIVARTGIACHPRDGQTPEALVARSSERLRGRELSAPVEGVVVEDPRMRRVYGLAGSAARGAISVIILGETGVGKDVMAQEIHRKSPRAKAPFVAINCAAVSEGLLESELFGHEKGAFTGATDAKAGLLETAPGGTVFLDEIGDMPPKLQATLLRVIQTRQVQRVGSVKTRPIDVRFIAATHRDLEAEIAAGRFRQDLYYRLNGITLSIPPLRERRSEILPLVRSFLAQFAREMGGDRPAPEVSPEAARLLEAYSWRGNVREVRNVVERALLLCEGSEILPEHLPIESMAANAISFANVPAPGMTPPLAAAPAPSPVDVARPTAPMGAVEDEKDRILRVLAECAGSQTRAAKVLGIARSTLIARLDEYGVPRPRK
ncbi:MAG TPA: sigma 54-interacting transcriptional regulator [Polyangia bacterium]|jgi:DNA-binding NtrC family response regulator|nr:sigma 54-interacting transcriptional regulator [Polyangia bacterium]